MANDVLINTGANTSGKANVDSSYAVRASLNQVNQRLGGETPAPNFVGAVRCFQERDPGAYTGTPLLASADISPDAVLQAGSPTPIFTDNFNATAQNQNTWKYATSTATVTWSGGFAHLSGAAASGNYTTLTTYKFFPMWGNAAIHAEFIGSLSATPVANQIFEAGFFLPVAGSTAPVDGVYFRVTNSGLVGIINYNGVETSTSVLIAGGSLPVNINGEYRIVLTQKIAEFWVNGSYLGNLPVPGGNGYPFMTEALPITLAQRATGTVTGGITVNMASLHVQQQDLNLSKPYADILAGMGQAGTFFQDGGTQGPAQFYTNNTNPTTALPTNTSLTSNLPTYPNGLGLATLWNLAATDMLMASYQVPSGGVNQTPRSLVIKGIKITSSTAAATWTAPAAGTHIWLWALQYGHTAVSLATGMGVAAKSPRVVTIGMQTWATAATPVGTPPDRGDTFMTFNTPLVVNPGEFVAITARMINGAATASGGIYYSMTLDAYWD